MKYFWTLCLFTMVSGAAFGQSTSPSSKDISNPPNKSEFTSNEAYSNAKQEWVIDTEAIEDNGAIELEAIILEGEDAEKDFIHPKIESLESTNGEELKPTEEPTMPELQ